ncbi:MAG: tail fiber domain-containing protein, partial [Bacteroidia bacterium]
ATNGYSSQNGSGVYGAIQGGGTAFGAVQGEYSGTNATGAGVHGIAITNTAVGVRGDEPTGAGWAGYFNGDVNVVAGFGYFNVSDRRLKTNIQPITNALEKLEQIGGYEYDMNKADYPKFVSVDAHKFGVMAQEVEKVFPALVKEKYLAPADNGARGSKADQQGAVFKAVNYDGLIPVLIEAVKEQQKEIEVLKAQVQSLENK